MRTILSREPTLREGFKYGGLELPNGSALVEIDVTCHLEGFRRFLINSTCRSFIPESYLRDSEVFPEKEEDPGSIYIEAADKVTLKKIRDITFINARDILGIIYTSKSGNSKLKWREMREGVGRLTGDASTNSLVNLSMARIITPGDVEEIMRKAGITFPPEEERQEPEAVARAVEGEATLEQGSAEIGSDSAHEVEGNTQQASANVGGNGADTGLGPEEVSPKGSDGIGEGLN